MPGDHHAPLSVKHLRNRVVGVVVGILGGGAGGVGLLGEPPTGVEDVKDSCISICLDQNLFTLT